MDNFLSIPIYAASPRSRKIPSICSRMARCLKLLYVGHRVDVEAGTDPGDAHSGGAKPAFGCLARARVTPGYAGQRARRTGTQSQEIKPTIIRRPQDSVPQLELFDCVGEVTRREEGRVGAQSNGGVGHVQTTVQNGFDSGAEICPLLEPDSVLATSRPKLPRSAAASTGIAPVKFITTDQTSCSMAAASPAARSAPTAQANRVFTRPGIGGLAKIQTGMPTPCVLN